MSLEGAAAASLVGSVRGAELASFTQAFLRPPELAAYATRVTADLEHRRARWRRELLGP